MDLRQKYGYLHKGIVTFIVLVLAIFSISSPLAWSLPDEDDYSRPAVYDDDDDQFISPDDDDDYRPSLPFRPRKAQGSVGKGDTPGSKWGQRRNGKKNEANNARFGSPKGKVVFRLVDDELIKKTLREKGDQEKQSLSQAPLIPDLNTDKKTKR